MLRNADKTKRFFRAGTLFSIVTICSFLFIGWGYVGHRIINYNTIMSALPDMEFFDSWADSLAAHASDADARKSWDPTEGPKHYIDIDNYPEFVANGTISQNFDSLVAEHGYSFVMDQGVLPWAIINTADSIEAAFEQNDMHKAMLLSADLGHYIADSHMPLHITRNYNGQYSGQTGVHSRYESNLVETFQSQIVYDGDSLQYIENVPDFVFNMIYDNYQYVDSVLYADSVAQAYAGNHNTSTYYNKFWEIAGDFTIGLFRKASYRIACVIYTEWINAGGSPTGIEYNETSNLTDFKVYQNYPNPFNPSTTISWYSPFEGQQTVKIYNAVGSEIATLMNEYKPAGTYTLRFDGTGLSSGIYFYRIQSGSYSSVKKMILLK